MLLLMPHVSKYGSISTVWKSSNFSVIQILHEINFDTGGTKEMVTIAEFGAHNKQKLISRKIWVTGKSLHFPLCENSENFLLLRFYVKSILVNSKGPQIANFTVAEALKFDFDDILPFWRTEICQNPKFRTYESVKLAKLISRKI